MSAIVLQARDVPAANLLQERFLNDTNIKEMVRQLNISENHYYRLQYVAYHIAMVICLSAAIILYSAGLWPPPAWLGPTALALVLLFTYALARQFPATRMNDQKELRFYPSVDILVLVTFVAFGPLIAAFFGFIHPWLSKPYLGGLVLLVGTTLAITISMLEKKTGKAIMLGLIIFEVILILAAIAFAVIVDLG